MEKISGVLFFLAGSIILMGITTAEIFYPPGYSTSRNFISTLGASPPPNSVSYYPSASIFDLSMLISGLMIVSGAVMLHKAKIQKSVSIPVACLGMGALGVGIFPAFHAIIHPILAGVTFVAGGIAAILSSRIMVAPFRYLAVGLGCLVLTVLIFGLGLSKLIIPILGIGGTERWVAYPLVLWLVGFGGYLMQSSKQSR
jgi:hypothetical membrane protein